jgi:hypothetical protein
MVKSSGFVLGESERARLLKADPGSSPVIFPYLIGRELLDGDGTPDRWVIDFEQRSMPEAQQFKGAFEHVQRTVLPAVRAKAEKEKEDNKNRDEADREDVRQKQLERWWIHWRGRADRIAAGGKLKGRYVACSRVTKRPVFVFVSLAIRPGDALQTFVFDDDYSFGVLQSYAHWAWFITKCSKQIRANVSDTGDLTRIKLTPSVKSQNRLNPAAFTDGIPLKYYTGAPEDLEKIPSMRKDGLDAKGQILFTSVVHDIAEQLGVRFEEVKQNVVETPKKFFK